MTTFAGPDAFGGTEGDPLQTYSANWTRHSSHANDVEIASGRARRTTANTIVMYYHGTAPAGADYTVECDVVKRSAVTENTGPAGRIDTGADKAYWFRYNNAAGGWQLARIVSGSVTQIGTTYTQSLTIDQAYRAKLEMTGDQITGYVDGVSRVGPITDTNITAAGRGGLRANGSGSTGDTVGYHLDNWQGDEGGSAQTATPGPVTETRLQGDLVVQAGAVTLGLGRVAELERAGAVVALSGGDVVTPGRVPAAADAGSITIQAGAVTLSVGRISELDRPGQIVASILTLTALPGSVPLTRDAGGISALGGAAIAVPGFVPSFLPGSGGMGHIIATPESGAAAAGRLYRFPAERRQRRQPAEARTYRIAA